MSSVGMLATSTASCHRVFSSTRCSLLVRSITTIRRDMAERLDELLTTLRGAQELIRSGAGVSPRRLPAWTSAQAADPALDVMAGMPAGVRFELMTDARSLELDVLATFLEVDGSAVGPMAAAFDLVVDGEVAGTEVVEEGTRVVVEMASGRF